MYSSVVGLAITFLVTLIGYFCLVSDEPAAVIKKMAKGQNSKNLKLFLFLMLATLGVNILELTLEHRFQFVTWDITPYVHAIEGDFTANLQDLLENSLLTHLLTYIYVFAFPAMIWVSLVYYNYKNDSKMMTAVLFGILLNYLIAFPFYVFFPVNEAWYHSSQVRPLIHDAYRTFETSYRTFSGMNNSFPSLHTSISLTMAIMATFSPYKRLARVMQVSAGLIVLATLYLGIHWLTDVIGGVVTAGVAVSLALSWERAADLALRIRQRFRPVYSRLEHVLFNYDRNNK